MGTRCKGSVNPLKFHPRYWPVSRSLKVVHDCDLKEVAISLKGLPFPLQPPGASSEQKKV